MKDEQQNNFLLEVTESSLVSWNICYNYFVAMTNPTNNSKTIRNTNIAKAAVVHQWPSSPHQQLATPKSLCPFYIAESFLTFYNQIQCEHQLG